MKGATTATGNSNIYPGKHIKVFKMVTQNLDIHIEMYHNPGDPQTQVDFPSAIPRYKSIFSAVPDI